MRYAVDSESSTGPSAAQGDDVFPIPGTRNPKHVEENVAALAFSRTLTAEEIAELEAAVPAAQVSGGTLSAHSRIMVSVICQEQLQGKRFLLKRRIGLVPVVDAQEHHQACHEGESSCAASP